MSGNIRGLVVSMLPVQDVSGKSEYFKKHYQKRKNKGCPCCGKPHTGEKVICLDCRLKNRPRWREHYHKNQQRLSERSLQRYHNTPYKERIQKFRDYRLKVKLEAYKKINGDKIIKCVYCGCDNIEALEINHKEGGGHKERVKDKLHHGGLEFYNLLRQNKYDISKLELTCIVCNARHRAIMKLGKNFWVVTYKKHGV